MPANSNYPATRVLIANPLTWLVAAVGAIAILFWLANLGWKSFGPHKPQLSTARQQLVSQVIPAMIEDLQENKKELRAVAVIPFKGDSTDFITDTLRAQIEESGVFNLIDRPLDEKVRKKLGVDLNGKSDLHSALAAARGTGADGVIFGEVKELESLGSEGKLHLALTLARIADGEIVFERDYRRAPGVSTRAAITVLAAVEQSKPSIRPRGFVIWVLLALLLPVVTIGFIQTIVRRNSNLSNAAALGIYTALNALLGWLVAGFSAGSWFGIATALALLTAALFYNVLVMSLTLKKAI